MALTRRSFLTRSAASAGALASLRRWPLIPSAPLDRPMRVVFVIKSSGIDKPNLVPGGGEYAEERTSLRELAFTPGSLPEVLAPLQAHCERLTVVQGLSGANLKGNHTAGFGTLSCHSSELAPIAPTVDALLGLRCSADAPYPMFGMATNGTLRGQQSVPDDSYVQPNLSAYGPGRGVPFQASPTKAWQELFGRTSQSAESLRKADRLQDNLRAFLEQDAGRIRDRLSDDEQQRFAGYVESFGSIRRREIRKAELVDRIAAHAPTYDEARYTSMQHVDRMACQMEMAGAALLAGLTHVVTLRTDTLGTMYGPLGIDGLGVHAIGHGGLLADGTTSEQIRRRIDRWHVELVARLADQLDAVPEGDGTVLDNTLIVLTSCAGGKHHGGNKDWPFVLLGDLGGRLPAGGRYLEYPSYGNAGHKGIASLYRSLLDAADIDYGGDFGQVDPGLAGLDLSGSLEALRA